MYKKWFSFCFILLNTEKAEAEEHLQVWFGLAAWKFKSSNLGINWEIYIWKHVF